MNPTSTQQPRFPGTVAVFFTAHLAGDSREWELIREFGNDYHPLAGYYRSDDPAIVRQQLHWMRRAGIDLIVYDAYATRKMSPSDMAQDAALPVLVNELARQGGESRPLQLCIYIEKYLGTTSEEEFEGALRYIREHLSEQPWYYRYHGRPLVLAYLNGENRAISEVEWKNTYFSLRRVRPYVSDVWSYVEHYPQSRRKDWMPASPGINAFLELAYVAKYVNKLPAPDFEEIRRNAPQAKRDNGEYYRKQLQWAKAANPEIIFVSGWNDWQYGTQIEPAVEYQCQYLDITADELGRAGETAPYRP